MDNTSPIATDIATDAELEARNICDSCDALADTVAVEFEGQPLQLCEFCA